MSAAGVAGIMKDAAQCVIAHEEKMRGLLARLETELRGVPDLFGGVVPLISLRVILRFDRRTGGMIATRISPEYEHEEKEPR
jgi:hypothetical protein